MIGLKRFIRQQLFFDSLTVDTSGVLSLLNRLNQERQKVCNDNKVSNKTHRRRCPITIADFNLATVYEIRSHLNEAYDNGHFLNEHIINNVMKIQGSLSLKGARSVALAGLTANTITSVIFGENEVDIHLAIAKDKRYGEIEEANTHDKRHLNVSFSPEKEETFTIFSAIPSILFRLLQLGKLDEDLPPAKEALKRFDCEKPIIRKQHTRRVTESPTTAEDVGTIGRAALQAILSVKKGKAEDGTFLEEDIVGDHGSRYAILARKSY